MDIGSHFSSRAAEYDHRREDVDAANAIPAREMRDVRATTTSSRRRKKKSQKVGENPAKRGPNRPQIFIKHNYVDVIVRGFDNY